MNLNLLNTLAAKPPWPGLGRKIERLTRKALFEHEMLGAGGKLAVALSGGKDSLTLLSMLKAISGRGFPELDLCAIHVSGAFSCGAGVNQNYLQAFCQELDVAYISKTTDQELATLECYSCSRERRKLIFNAAKEFGADHVAFGHHRDDHVQTLLMNLLHKAEFCGNQAKILMKRYDMTIIRPLIYVPEEMIKNFAKDAGYLRVMCQCPVGQNSLRKKTDALLKEIEEHYPRARHNIAKAGFTYGSDKALYLKEEKDC